MSSKLELTLEKKQLELWQSNDSVIIPPKVLSYLNNLAYYQRNHSDNSYKLVAHVGELSDVTLPPVGSELQNAEFFNWGDVASTIHNHILRSTNFNPGTVEPESAEFRAFLNMFTTCPYWNGLDFGIQHRDVSIKCQHYTDVVNAVQDMIGDFIGEIARQRVIESIKKAIELAREGGESDDKNVLIKTNIISGNHKGLYVFVLYSFVQMVRIRQEIHDILEQELRVVAGHGLLNTDFCNRNAANIIGYDKMTLEQWEKLAKINKYSPNINPC